MTPDEEWRPVVGYEGFYEVSSIGHVRSVDRTIDHPLGPRPLKGRTRRLTINYGGYPTVILSRDGKPRTLYVHKLVAEAFIGPIPDGLHVLHWNDIKTDNRPANLRYGTPSDNQLDRIRNGIHPVANRSHCKNGHEFTPENTGPLTNRPGRRCRKCAAEVSRRRRARESAA